MTDRRAGRPLSQVLAAAFVAVAIAAVATLALVVWLTTTSETTRLSSEQREQTARQVSQALADEYGRRGSWSNLDASAAVALAAQADAVLIVRASDGRVVVDSRPGRGPGTGAGGMHASTLTRPISAAGRTVGVAEVRFRGTLAQAEQRLRDKLAGAVLFGSAIAVAVALVVTFLVARRISRPVGRLTAAARRLEGGDLSARAAQARAPGELGTLAAAFDSMAEALDRQERSRRQLVADLAHELRTPVTILRGNLEELIDGAAEATPQRLGSLHEEILRLGALVAQLDALGRSETPVDQLQCEPVDLGALAATEVNALCSQFDANGVAINCAVQPAVLLGDRMKLGQVVTNLLSNAIKFTPPGGHVDVAAGTTDGEVWLQIADSGPGISPAEREHVFERFWRGNDARAVAGSGIGLAVVYEIVRAHRGRVEVDDAPGGGARFTVRAAAAPTGARG